ncbi:cupin domain-containing protein, partial [Pseudomonas aeruginosa]|uniref:cupin domain-containing protein n=1 Tax=Pseudomonas aeruginosa TaxID=287 RepID=UPI000ADBEB32
GGTGAGLTEISGIPAYNPFNEQATVVTGEVILTDESTGQTTRFKAGDSWYVAKGTPVLWEVPGESFVKHYYAVA